MHGTYHHLSSKHLPHNLAEVSYRFNRPLLFREMFPRFAIAVLRTAPMPYRVLKLAENCAYKVSSCAVRVMNPGYRSDRTQTSTSG